MRNQEVLSENENNNNAHCAEQQTVGTLYLSFRGPLSCSSPYFCHEKKASTAITGSKYNIRHKSKYNENTDDMEGLNHFTLQAMKHFKNSCLC